MSEPILTVSDLSVTFPSEAGPVHAVQNLDYESERGEALAIVGESGSGKSVSSLAVMGLLPSTATVTGSIDFMGQDMFAWMIASSRGCAATRSPWSSRIRCRR